MNSPASPTSVRPSFRIAEWLAPGATIDLGGRVLTVLNTPGHTPTSTPLQGSSGPKRPGTGDYIHPTTLYAFSPAPACRPITRQRKAPARHPARRYHPVDRPLLPQGWRHPGALLRMKDLRDLGNQFAAGEGGRSAPYRILSLGLSGQRSDDVGDRFLEQIPDPVPCYSLMMRNLAALFLMLLGLCAVAPGRRRCAQCGGQSCLPDRQRPQAGR